MRIAGLLVLLFVLEGCVYARSNLHHGKAGYKNYPTSVEAEHERRRTRRRHALIAAPLEIVGGLALVALARYAPSEPSDAMTPTGALGDAGKELLGRLLLASVGLAVAGSGVGDGILGAVDPAFRSPIVRRGRLIPASEIDTITPPRGPRLGFHATSVIGSDGVGADLGFGFAHWVTPNVRLRHSASADYALLWGTTDRRLIVSGETLIERAFGREAAGLYPKRAIGLYAGGGWSFLEDREDLPVLRAGVSLNVLRGISYRLGTTYAPGDRTPSIELGMRGELRVD